MQSVILAGGLGTRLRSVVNDRPKAMAPVAGRPFLEYLVEWVRQAGCEEVILAVSYRREQIAAHFGDGSRFGVRIRYAVEETPQGTGGALRNAEEWVRDAFLAMNGDTFWDLDLSRLLAAHEDHKAQGPNCLGTLALMPAADGPLPVDARACGHVALDRSGRIRAFREKTGREDIGGCRPCAVGSDGGSATPATTQLVSAGIYLLEPEIFRHIPAKRAVSLETEVFPGIIDGTRALFGFATRGHFVDIGTPEGYRGFERLVMEGATRR
jgi:mannose-1-phosphate guanylyltransferase